VRYTIRAYDPGLNVVDSEEYVVPVQATCANPARSRKKADLAVTAPLGAPRAPAGFVEPPPREGVVVTGTTKGIFGFGPAASLAGALAVAGAGVAVAVIASTGTDKPPTREPQMELPGVTFLASTPPEGSTLRLGRDILDITLRVVSPEAVTGVPILELFQSPGGPVCATSLTRGQVFLSAGFGQNVSLQVASPTLACGGRLEVGFARLRLVGIFNGQGVFQTGTGGIPDLAVRYSVAP